MINVVNASLEDIKNDTIQDDADTPEDSYDKDSIYPYDMPKEVDVQEDPQSVFEWMRKLKKGVLVVDPDFQRNRVWKLKQKAQFIESVLLNIPLPPLYVNQTVEGKYIVVDGLQRTSTLSEFINENSFALKDLELLKELNGLTFKELNTDLQAKIEDKKFYVYIIKPSVPLPMVYDIFHRINTGGTQLTRQEIRNCFYIGPATKLLKKLAESNSFIKAIDNGISDNRMKAREAILRYLAFDIQDYKTDYKGDMDAFLGSAMKLINKMTPEDILNLEVNFNRVMNFTIDFFGERNFRLPTGATKGRVNIALFEVISCFFSKKDSSYLSNNKNKIILNYEELLKNDTFIDSIKHATGDTRRVNNRFDISKEILGKS